ncbi:hypothetical protein IFR04_009609 [Cadophora malorum]|uniref:Uncharacterized protein n=1 Tax=Cadophora malorum TaxID=108018 RepID=A0A8H7WA55_9HELO|nr:hypothetical protein IFR04_009609 [Cadophora malorum]
MLPQEPRESYTWGDTCFNDWIKSSPDEATYLHTDSSPSSRRISISDLLSSPPPLRSSAKSTNENSMDLDSTDELAPIIVRSPRSADLVGLCRRNSIPGLEGETSGDTCSFEPMEARQRDGRAKGKARETSTSEDYGSGQCYPEEEWEVFWKGYETQARRLEAFKHSYDDKDFDMNFTNEYRRSNMGNGGMSPAQNDMGPTSSPTWGRRRQRTSSSDFDYDHMAIEELMRGMEVYSDTEYEQIEEMSDFSRILFGRSCFPEISSSKTYGSTTNGKRKASHDLDEPNFKKWYIANPLRGDNFKYSVNPLLNGNRVASPYREGQQLRRHISNHPVTDERVVSVAYPVHDAQILYGRD